MNPFHACTVVCEAVAEESDDSEDMIVLEMYDCVVWFLLLCRHIPIARAHRSLPDVLITEGLTIPLPCREQKFGVILRHEYHV